MLHGSGNFQFLMNQFSNAVADVRRLEIENLLEIEN